MDEAGGQLYVYGMNLGVAATPVVQLGSSVPAATLPSCDANEILFSQGPGAWVCRALCAAGHADCDANLSNGCETSIQSDPRNCGACGRACAGGVCVAGQCGWPDGHACGSGAECVSGYCVGGYCSATPPCTCAPVPKAPRPATPPACAAPPAGRGGATATGTR